MPCTDCTQHPKLNHPAKVPFQVPTGYTGCTLASLARALPEPIPGTPYALPRVAVDGTIIYAHDEQPPPPDINGYRRNLDDPWRFHPLWNECTMRIHGTSRNRRSGAINVVMICNHPNSPHQGVRLTHPHCADCLLRLSKDNP
jgi:hypothetical protein